MKNKDYTDLVDQENYPDFPLVPLDAPFVNDAGTIQNLINCNIGGSAIIISKKGSIRSNHWHKEDFHYLYLISGSMEYYERDLNEIITLEYKPLIVSAGQLIFTGPNKVHKTVFIEDSVMISFSKRPRDHESHELDVIREEF